MQEKYIDFTEEQLLQDPYFIKWVKHQNKKDDEFWSGLLASNPPNIERIKAAKLKLTILLSADNIDTTLISKEEVWKSVSNSIHPARGSSRPVLYKWLAAASVVLLLTFLGAYFNNNANTNEQVANKKVGKVQEIKPGGNKAILQLADGSTIVLDSTGNRNIASQGQTQITNIDGQLAYNAVGSSTEILYNTISTPRGGQYQLLLADGSKVWLNAASSIRFPAAFPGRERNVEITGEVYFEVAHNAAKPFIVKANGVDIKVLGTSFNVNAYEDEELMKTTLLEGSVEISRDNRKSVLRPGEQAQILNNSDNIRVVQNANVEEAVAWKNGLFFFNEESVENVMKKISRWYDVDVEIKGSMAGRKFKGKIYRDADLSQIVKILEEGGIQINITGNKIIVTK